MMDIHHFNSQNPMRNPYFSQNSTRRNLENPMKISWKSHENPIESLHFPWGNRFQGSVFSSGHDFGDFDEALGTETHRRTLKLCSQASGMKEVENSSVVMIVIVGVIIIVIVMI